MMLTRNRVTSRWAAVLAVAGLAGPVFGQFSLTVNADPADGGSTAVFPQQSSYEDGDEVTLTATAAEGFEFAGWGGDITASESTIVFLMTGDVELTAMFTEAGPATFKLTAFVDPSGAGTIVRDPAEFEYEDGAEVTLTAYAGDGFVFTGWSGDLPEGADAASSELTVTMSSDVNIEATFAAAQQLDGATGAGCGAMGLAGFGLMLSLMAAQYVGLKRRR